MEKILTLIIICLALWSCDKYRSCENLVEFEFQLLDENGEQATTFAFEENFSFNFSIINNTEDALFLSEMYNMDSFFEVFKIEDSGELVSYGKPYNAIFCEYIGGYKIPSSGSLLVELSWIPGQDIISPILCNLKHDNTPLPAGNYQTGISTIFTFQKGEEDFLTKESSIDILFQITP